MPLTITSGRCGQNSEIPSLTASAGLPSTAHPRLLLPSKISLAVSGVKKVIACPTPLCSVDGATTLTVARRRMARSMAARPGAKMPSSFVRSACMRDLVAL